MSIVKWVLLSVIISDLAPKCSLSTYFWHLGTLLNQPSFTQFIFATNPFHPIYFRYKHLTKSVPNLQISLYKFYKLGTVYRPHFILHQLPYYAKIPYFNMDKPWFYPTLTCYQSLAIDQIIQCLPILSILVYLQLRIQHDSSITNTPQKKYSTQIRVLILQEQWYHAVVVQNLQLLHIPLPLFYHYGINTAVNPRCCIF